MRERQFTTFRPKWYREGMEIPDAPPTGFPPEPTAEELAHQEAIRGAIERLRDMVGATIDLENASVDCVRDMWVLAQEYIRENA